MKPQWKAHGTSVNVKNPGTYWSVSCDRVIFTPAPYNCRRIAAEEALLMNRGKAPKFKSYFV